MKQLLANPLIWEISRIGLDAAFGLYRKRVRLLREWGLVQNSPSILDIGCGIGQYASVTDGMFLGVDMSQAYIKYARKRHRRPNQTFRCASVAAVLKECSTFDLVLMVDFLHHLGRWIVEHDRGHYVRPLEELGQLYPRAGLSVIRDDPLWLGPIHTRAILCRPVTQGVEQ